MKVVDSKLAGPASARRIRPADAVASSLTAVPASRPSKSAEQPGAAGGFQAKTIAARRSDPHEREADAVAELAVRSASAPRAAPREGSKLPGPTAAEQVGLQAKPAVSPARMTPDPSTSPERPSGAGQPVPAHVRELVEPLLGHDLSATRIHTGPAAQRLNQRFGARALTSGAHVAFAQGQYDPRSRAGLRLIAHELTHVVQQGAAAPRRAEAGSASPPARVRPAPLASTVQLQAEQESPQPEAGGGLLDWLASLAGKAVRAIPGWDVATLLLGYDPVGRRPVPRTAENLVKGFVGLVPGGALLHDKLVDSGLSARALGWVESNLDQYGLTLGRIRAALAAVRQDLGLLNWDVAGALQQHLGPIFADARRFAAALAARAVALLKAALLPPLLRFIQERTGVYPLLTVILGKDPITDELVPRSPYNILSAFAKFTPSGEAMLGKLEESGRLQQMLQWLDVQLANLDLNATTIGQTFATIWRSLDATSVLHPLDTFARIWSIIEPPIGRVTRLVAVVSRRVFALVKGWLLGKLAAMAQAAPGYPLLGVVLQRDPITQELVPRTAENFLRGFLSLVPGGLEKFENLKASGAVQRAFAWLNEEVTTLDLTWNRVVGLFYQAWSSLSVADLLDPVSALARLFSLFASPIGRIFSFAGAVLRKVAEFVFVGFMGSAGAQIVAVLARSQQTFGIIVADPIGFAGNLMAAVKQGFQSFSGNILEHLKSGLFGWLFGALSGAGIQLPERLNLKGIVSVVLQVLGVTYARVRVKLVKHMGEGVVSKLESAFDFFKRLVVEGPMMLWSQIAESVGNLSDMVIGAIKKWVVTRVVTAAVLKIVSMLNPAGAIVQAVLAIYNTISFFISRIKQILALVEAVLNSLSNIALGKLGDAAAYVEKTMARMVPLVIGFLARLVGLGDVSGAIRGVIEKIRAKVDGAIDKVVGFVVKRAKSMLAKGKAVTSSVVAWWKQRRSFRMGKEKHSIHVGGERVPGPIMVSSEPQTLEKFIERSALSTDDKESIRELAKEIDDRKRPGGRSVSFGKTAGAEIAERLKEIAAILAGAKEERPPSIVRDKKPRTGALFGLSGDGEVVHVEPLSIVPGKLVGSKPYGESPLWKELRVRRNTYVRGHLLNHQVHGPGEIWNMTPIPHATNSQMEKGFESKVKTKVMDENEVVSYKANVVYGNRERRQLRAEQMIATKLELSSYVMERKDGSKSGALPDNWEQTSTKVATANLTIDLPPETDDRVDVVKVLNLGNYETDATASPGTGLAKLPEAAERNKVALGVALGLLKATRGIGEKRGKAILEARPTTPEELLGRPRIPRQILEDLLVEVGSNERLVLAGRGTKSIYEQG